MKQTMIFQKNHCAKLILSRKDVGIGATVAKLEWVYKLWEKDISKFHSGIYSPLNDTS